MRGKTHEVLSQPKQRVDSFNFRMEHAQLIQHSHRVTGHQCRRFGA